MKRGRWIALVILGVVVVAAGAFAVLNLMGRPAASEQPSSSVSAASSAPPTTSTSPPVQAELASLDRALSTTAEDELVPFIPLGKTEHVSPAFLEQLKSLNLSLDETSLAETTPGVWTVNAADKTGKTWEIALVRVQGQLKILYAEEAK